MQQTAVWIALVLLVTASRIRADGDQYPRADCEPVMSKIIGPATQAALEGISGSGVVPPGVSELLVSAAAKGLTKVACNLDKYLIDVLSRDRAGSMDCRPVVRLEEDVCGWAGGLRALRCSTLTDTATGMSFTGKAKDYKEARRRADEAFLAWTRAQNNGCKRAPGIETKVSDGILIFNAAFSSTAPPGYPPCPTGGELANRTCSLPMTDGMPARCIDSETVRVCVPNDGLDRYRLYNVVPEGPGLPSSPGPCPGDVPMGGRLCGKVGDACYVPVDNTRKYFACVATTGYRWSLNRITPPAAGSTDPACPKGPHAGSAAGLPCDGSKDYRCYHADTKGVYRCVRYNSTSINKGNWSVQPLANLVTSKPGELAFVAQNPSLLTNITVAWTPPRPPAGDTIADFLIDVDGVSKITRVPADASLTSIALPTAPTLGQRRDVQITARTTQGKSIPYQRESVLVGERAQLKCESTCPLWGGLSLNLVSRADVGVELLNEETWGSSNPVPPEPSPGVEFEYVAFKLSTTTQGLLQLPTQALGFYPWGVLKKQVGGDWTPSTLPATICSDCAYFVYGTNTTKPASSTTAASTGSSTPSGTSTTSGRPPPPIGATTATTGRPPSGTTAASSATCLTVSVFLFFIVLLIS